MIFLSLSVAGFVLVAFVVIHAIAKQVFILEKKLAEYDAYVIDLNVDVMDLEDEVRSLRNQLRDDRTKLASHDELIALAHAKFDRLTISNVSVSPQRITPTLIPTIQSQTARAERDLKDATTSP